jgi:hypothetical protein
MPDPEHLALIASELASKVFEEAEAKRIFKEALNEWLDFKFAQFGKWTFYGLFASLFGAFVVFVLWTQGYHR